MRALVVCLVMAFPATALARPWTYVQGDLSAGANHHDDGRPETEDRIGLGSIWLGTAFPMDPERRAFAGFGGEVTFDGANGPYEWSVAGGTRVGLAWRWPEGPAGPLPDLYVYSRITPFVGFRSVASEEYLGENPEITRRGQGLRVGVGFTSPAWTAIVWPAVFDSDLNGALSAMNFSGDAGEAAALACIVTVAVLLLNHGELTYEIYREPGQPTVSRVGWRVGLGF